MTVFRMLKKHFLFVLLMLPHSAQAQDNCAYTRINGKRFWRCMSVESVFREGQTPSKNMVSADLLRVGQALPVTVRRSTPTVSSKKQVRASRYKMGTLPMDLGATLGLTSFSSYEYQSWKKIPPH